ncbi:MAG: hypothetical protein AAGB22_06810 [Bacteroidota bacterium]
MDGPRALIGAVQKTVNLGPLTFTEVGSAHLFERTDNGTWQQVHLFSASDRASEDNYGHSVDLSGDHVFIGANREDGSQGPFSQTAATGALYTYRFCPTSDTIAVHACGPYTAPSGNVYAIAGSYLDTTVNTAGCDSVNLIHLTIGAPTEDTLVVGSCGPYLAPSGTVTWNFSGTYQDVIPNASGCDSVMIVQLTIDPVDVSVTRQNAALIANEFNAAYQWLDCNSGFAAVDGATERIFTPENNGSFAVRVDNGSCVDTSTCFPLTNVSTGDLMAQEGLRMFPNPTDGQLTIVAGTGSVHRIRIVALDGRVLYDYQPATPTGSTTIAVPGPSGIYTAEVWRREDEQPFRQRLVKLAP